MLKGKMIIVGVTGGIAAFKAAQLVSDLVKLGAEVHVIMTRNATNFINPITFETLSGNKCLIDTFDRNFEFKVEHVSLSQRADAFLIAPASANVIGKLANGIADDMLTTMALATHCRIIVAPAMNTRMFENPIVQDNMAKLRRYHFTLIEPTNGRLACGDTGKGKLPDIPVLLEYLKREVTPKDLTGKRIVVTAGPTRESLDPVRYLTNHSTGKMGYAIAEAAAHRGAEVTLISGPVQLKASEFVRKTDIVSAKDLFRAVKESLPECDILIMAAAVADYTPTEYQDEKIKKKDEDLSLSLQRTKDILAYAGENKKQGQIICGFSMETQNLLENSMKKLRTKNCDIIAANSLRKKGSGFGTDTNELALITKDGIRELPLLSKEEAAHQLLDAIKSLSNRET